MKSASNQRPSRLVGERLRCVGRRISKPRLIHYTHDHRAVMVDIEGYPAIREVVREWRIVRKRS